MIQRIQTIFMFLIVLAMGVFLSFPIWDKTGIRSTETAQLTALQYSYQQGITTYPIPMWYLAGLAVLVALIALIAIFRYRNRLQQMGLCAVNALLMTGMMAIILYTTLYKGKTYGMVDDQGNYHIGFYALIAALIFNMLANRFIRRDEKLVRDSDRFR
ncbi:DUF4293 domain-containing protein [Nibrella viscosa]|uniref:DUF4293 domain-containing protein n=1 Tax=Nibrella viscosa TaxID=1084524 RepID=A0ABP8KF64_9BACT